MERNELLTAGFALAMALGFLAELAQRLRRRRPPFPSPELEQALAALAPYVHDGRRLLPRARRLAHDLGLAERRRDGAYLFVPTRRSRVRGAALLIERERNGWRLRQIRWG